MLVRRPTGDLRPPGVWPKADPGTSNAITNSCKYLPWTIQLHLVHILEQKGGHEKENNIRHPLKFPAIAQQCLKRTKFKTVEGLHIGKGKELVEITFIADVLQTQFQPVLVPVIAQRGMVLSQG